MDIKLINAQETAYRVGISCKTLDIWYRFKRENPSNEYALMIPEYYQETSRSKRLWKESDVAALINFKNSIPQGRGGVLGSVTQKYLKKNTDKVASVKRMATGAETPKNTRTAYIGAIEALMKNNGVVDDTAEYVMQILKSELEWRAGINIA